MSLYVAGCGSQIDSLEVPPVRRESSAPAGIYQGNFTLARAGTSEAVIAAVSAQRFFLFNSDGSLIAGGIYEAAARNLTWRARSFERVSTTTPTDEGEGAPEVVVSQRLRLLTAEGSFIPDDSVLLSFSLDAEDPSGGAESRDSGTLALQYNRRQHLRRSDLPLVAGVWANEDSFGTATATFTIGQGGEVFGQDEDGCSYSGNLSLIDQRFNLYASGLRVQCPGNDGVALLEAGLATLRQEEDLSETLVIVGSSRATATLLQLRKGS